MRPSSGAGFTDSWTRFSGTKLITLGEIRNHIRLSPDSQAEVLSVQLKPINPCPIISRHEELFVFFCSAATL